MHVFTHVHFLQHPIPEPESINAPKFQFQNDENTVLFADMENHITITYIYTCISAIDLMKLDVCEVCVWGVCMVCVCVCVCCCCCVCMHEVCV